MSKLIPVDLERCQAEITLAHGPFVLGPRPKPHRCPNPAAYVIEELKASAEDGQKGSQSVCVDCVPALNKAINEGVVQKVNVYDLAVWKEYKK